MKALRDKQSTGAVLLQAMLGPVARYALRNSVRIQRMIEMLKIALVRAAEMECRRIGAKASTSKISIMTGIHRKDIERLLAGSIKADPPDLLTRVIGQWLVDPRFTNRANQPRPLSLDQTDETGFV